MGQDGPIFSLLGRARLDQVQLNMGWDALSFIFPEWQQARPNEDWPLCKNGLVWCGPLMDSC